MIKTLLIVLSKILVLPVYPLGLSVILIAVGLVLLLLRRYKSGTALIAIAGAVLYLFSAEPVSYWLVRSLEEQYNPSVSFPPVSAIVLLSGAEVAKTPPRLYDEVNAAGDRIFETARLIRRGAAPRVIITGGNLDFIRPICGSQAEASCRMLTTLFSVDSSLIILENRARNTYENGLFTKKILDSLRVPPAVILVTSALHMPRSSAIFRKRGFTVFPAPVDYLADTPHRWGLVYFFPNAEALANSTNALHEIYGMLAYRVLGWM